MIDFSDKTTCDLKQPESVTPQFALIYTNGVGATSILLKVQVSDYTQHIQSKDFFHLNI